MAAAFLIETTAQAKRDLELIVDYVTETRSQVEAEALLAKLLDQAAKLETFPFRGAVPKEFDGITTDFRQTLVSPYRLVYRVIDTTVFIVLVADGRRDMATLLERRLLT